VNEHDAIARIKRLSHNINCADEIAEVIERLINERDEARQMICRLHFTSAELQHDFAKAKGWDCYKEDGK